MSNEECLFCWIECWSKRLEFEQISEGLKFEEFVVLGGELRREVFHFRN